MKYFFNALYIFVLILASPWIAWRVCIEKKNRRGWLQKLFGWVTVRTGNAECIWIHAVSVGEVNLLKPLVDRLQLENPDIEVCISTTTETGFDLANKKFPDKLVFFCPSDFSWSIANTINRIRPSILVLTELELWPNLITVVKQNSIPIALINGRISDKSFNGYRRFRAVTKPMFAALDLALMQTESYANRILELGTPADRVQISGNIKFDCCDADGREHDKELARRAGIHDQQFVIVAGSTQENEDIMAINVYQDLSQRFNQLKLILVPRHPQRCHRISKLLHDRGLAVFQRSIDRENEYEAEENAVVLVDVIGELNYWWSHANVAYVGGSMGDRGGQNMIEPAVYGLPICFGPDTRNFKDVVDMMLAGDAAAVVADRDQFREFILFVLGNPEAAHKMGERASALTMTQKGAVDRTLRLILPLLSATQQNTCKRAA